MKSHGFDALSFVFGIVFLAIAGSAVWDPSLRWDLGAWLVPAAVLTLGIGLLVSALRSRDSGADTARISSDSTPDS